MANKELEFTLRLKADLEASLQQQAATDALANSFERGNSVAQEANSAWQQTAAAQTEAMNAYHNAERATEQKAQAGRKASLLKTGPNSGMCLEMR